VCKPRFIFFLFLCCGLSCSISAQNSEDSLLKVLATQQEDTNKVRTLNALSWLFYSTNSNRSLDYAQKTLALAEKIKDLKGIASALNTIGIAYYFKGNYPEAQKNYIRAAGILEEKKEGQSINREKLSAIYNNIAAIFLTENRYADAEKYFLRSLQMDSERGDKVGMAQSYNNIGTIYKDLSKYDQALNYYLKALALHKESHDDDGLPSTLTNIGVAYLNLHKPLIAKHYLDEASVLYRKTQDSTGMALLYYNLGDLYDEFGEYPKALLYYDSCLRLSQKNNYLGYVSYSYGSLALVHGKLKNFEKAFQYHRLYMKAKDSIYNKDNADQLSLLETRYETDKKEKELQLQAAEIQVKKLETVEANRQKTMFRNFFLIFIAFTVIFVGILVNRYKIKQKANRLLEEKNRLIEHQKGLVEQKQKEILDSIQYARRIQQSLLPNDKYIERVLGKLKKSK